MNKGKAKCDRLKKIRKTVADAIGVDLHQKECTFEGNCTGTCPKCKQEEELLNRALLSRASAIAVAGVATMSLAACGTKADSLSGMAELAPETKVETHNSTEDVTLIEGTYIPELGYRIDDEVTGIDREGFAGPSYKHIKVTEDGTRTEATHEEYEKYLECKKALENGDTQENIALEGDLEVITDDTEEEQECLVSEENDEILGNMTLEEYTEGTINEEDDYVLEGGAPANVIGFE